MTDNAQLKLTSNLFDLPVTKATYGPDGLHVGGLRNEKFVMLDPGFLTTAQCESKITFIDGSNSTLLYRGYPIEELAEKSTFLETAYLLLNGELPTEQIRDEFIHDVNQRTAVGEDFRGFLSSFPRTAHPMGILGSAIAAMGTFIPGTSAVHDPHQVDEAAKNILAKTRTIIAFIYRRMNDAPLLYSNQENGYIDDFERMCFARPFENFEPDQLFVSALDKLLILQADHEQNCSTTVVRITGSSDASLYSSVAAGVNALSGPLHGGANERALQQIFDIRDSELSVKEYVERAKSEKRVIFGLGHRVYKSYDPRAKVAREWLFKILEKSKVDPSLFETALELEEIALSDPYFVERGLYPNIDFWTGLAYYAIGFPPKMFTSLFALARIPGWISHWKEMHSDPEAKIGRPRQVYTGSEQRPYIGVDQRTLSHPADPEGASQDPTKEK